MMTPTMRVVQAFDRTLITEVAADDGDALERKLAAAAKAMRNRDGWLKPHQRSAVLQRAASLLEGRQEPFATLIAREGGKPISDAAVEVTRAIDGLRNAAEALRTFGGREIPMGLTPASDRRWAFTTKEPIGVVAAISAFNHPLNLIVHQVAPAIAVGCPVIVKPATATPLSCLELVKLFREAGLDEAWCQTFITADNALAERLATDSRIAFLSFIGSARVGWHLHSRLAAGNAMRAGAWRRRSSDCRSQRQPRFGHRADRQRRLLPRRPGVRVDTADLRAPGHHRRLHRPVDRPGRAACASAIRCCATPRSVR